ncbi:MAG: DNA polymerase III subunit epsilon [Candidatus Dormibacteria bacterium]
MREIILDTETTGLDPRLGHRVVEIACVELEDHTATGAHFHCYVNPEREVEAGAQRVHGLSREFLSTKPRFADPQVAHVFLAFVDEARLIAHNAAFDRAFLNQELALAGLAAIPEGRWIDSLALAQERFPGMYNSLDALCKRFRISLADRSKHGALIDARLLARVYLELRGGREQSLDLAAASLGVAQAMAQAAHGSRPAPLAPRLTAEEMAAHAAFVAQELGDGALWLAT